MTKKVGIVSLYHNNNNYGGTLQAYALTKFINDNGFEAQQLSFPNSNVYKKEKPSLKQRLKNNKGQICKRLIGFVNGWIYKLFIKKKILIRDKAITQFRDTIPHKNYTDKTLDLALPDHDIFVVGSDQVWNFEWYNSAYFLDFVPMEKTKFSYAASLANNVLTDSQKEIIKNSLKDFSAVSVRENSSVEVVSQLTNLPVEHVLDPTLLLTKEEWQEVCSQRQVPDKYLFCYFLGNSKKARKLAKQYARKHRLKIVFMPYLLKIYRACDLRMRGKRVYDATPQQFLSLIQHAECIFTDSFHGTVFSHVFQKEYFIFKRNAKDKMSSRLYSLTQILGTEERFFDQEQELTLKTLEDIKQLDYTTPNQRLEEIKNRSISFLLNNLK